MVAAENVQTAYHSSLSATNWAEWTESNPVLAKILVEAEQLAHGELND